MKTLGTAACPPYHLAFVVGGTSAEMTMKTVKLASAGYLDGLPTKGSASAHAFRDLELEEKILKISQEIGVGTSSAENISVMMSESSGFQDMEHHVQ